MYINNFKHNLAKSTEFGNNFILLINSKNITPSPGIKYPTVTVQHNNFYIALIAVEKIEAVTEGKIMEVLSFNKNMLMMMIMMAMMWSIAKSKLHYVGGNRYGWVPGGNLTQWSLNEQFIVGESWLCKFSSLIVWSFLPAR